MTDPTPPHRRSPLEHERDDDALTVAWMAGAENARDSMKARVDALEAERDRMFDALERIYLWSEAYPTQVFSEPDLARAAALLSAGGMSLDIISASVMRRTTHGVGQIALAALSKKET